MCPRLAKSARLGAAERQIRKAYYSMNEQLEDPFDPLTDEMRAMLLKFREVAVPHIVIGGFAVRVHGFLRTVRDLDLLVESTDDSLARLSKALTNLGVKEVANIAALFRRSAKAKWRWRDGHDDHYVDLLTQLDNYGFAAVAEDSLLVSVGNMQISVLSKEKLIASKRTAAANPKRGEKALQDMEDLEALSTRHGLEEDSDFKARILRA